MPKCLIFHTFVMALVKIKKKRKKKNKKTT